MGNKWAFRIGVFFVVFLTGLCILFYPKVNGALTDYKMRGTAEEFLSYVQTGTYVSETTEWNSPSSPEDADLVVPEQYPQLWQDMRAYNTSLYETSQSGLSNPSAYEQPSFTLSDYGLESEVFGVISIPRLDVELPLYLGATKQHMADGAAHMSQTSLPIGGENTNCVIAGHRGWNGAAYFLYLPQLEPGDAVTVTTLWETMTYQVVEETVISPNDVDAIRIQPGRELLTLLTCHPPASGGKQRYLVICERQQNEMEEIA